jgi:soluble lytic murein transglycosylase
VTKVLANIQVYRARLGSTKNALRLQQDLQRARAGSGRGSSNESRATNVGDNEG